MKNRTLGYCMLMILAINFSGCTEEEPANPSSPPVDKRLKISRSQINSRRSVTRFEVNGVNKAVSYQGKAFDFVSTGKIEVLDSNSVVKRSGNFTISSDSLVFTITFSGTPDVYSELNGSYNLYLNNGTTWDFTATVAPFRRLVLTFRK